MTSEAINQEELSQKLVELTQAKIPLNIVSEEIAIIFGEKFESEKIQDKKLQAKVRKLIAERLVNNAAEAIGQGSLEKFEPTQINKLIRLTGLVHCINQIKTSLFYGKSTAYLNAFEIHELQFAIKTRISDRLIPSACLEVSEQDPMPCIEAEGWLSLNCFILENNNALTKWLTTVYSEKLESWNLDKALIARRSYTLLSCIERSNAYA